VLRSDRGDRDVCVSGGETCEVARVKGEDHASTEPERCRHNERIDGHLASGACSGEQVTGNSGGAYACGHDLGEAAGQDRVDDGIGAAASVQLDEHRRRHAHWEVPLVGAAHRRADALMEATISHSAYESMCYARMHGTG